MALPPIVKDIKGIRGYGDKGIRRPDHRAALPTIVKDIKAIRGCGGLITEWHCPPIVKDIKEIRE